MKHANTLLKELQEERAQLAIEEEKAVRQFLADQNARIETGLWEALRAGRGVLRIPVKLSTRVQNGKGLETLQTQLNSIGYECAAAPATPSDCPEHSGTRGVCNCHQTYWLRVRVLYAASVLAELGIEKDCVHTINSLDRDAKTYVAGEDDE